MKNLITVLILQVIGCNCFSQGSWNIGYIEIDSVSKSDIGKTVKIDFKHTWPEDSKPKSISVRSFVTPQDSGQISLDGTKMNVIERRKIYVDHGSFGDQYLELASNIKSHTVRVYNSELLDIESEKIKFIISIETFELKRGMPGNKLKSVNHEIWIDKEQLDGLMIKI